MDYYLDYSQYNEWLRYGSTLENKSLLARGVKHLGYMDNSYHTNVYQVFVPQHLTPKEYPKLAKLLIDIHNESDSDRIHVYIVIRDGNIEEFRDYLEEYPQLVCYRVGGYIEWQVGDFSRPHFDYLKL